MIDGDELGEDQAAEFNDMDGTDVEGGFQFFVGQNYGTIVRVE